MTHAQSYDRYASFPPHIPPKLKSVGEERIRDLDNEHVSLQVISHGPGIRPPALCTAANNELASAVRKNSSRMAGFAMLPISDPAAAAKELERCNHDLEFVGALLDNHDNGEFYDNKRFWPIFEKAEELDVPIYIHPSFDSDDHFDHYKGEYNNIMAFLLSTAGWGWHSETALSILKLLLVDSSIVSETSRL